MISVVGISVIVLILLVIFWFTNVHMAFHYRHCQDDDWLTLNVRIWGLSIYKFEVPDITFDEDSSSLIYKQKRQAAKMNQQEIKNKVTSEDLLEKLKMAQRLLEKVGGFHKIMRRFLGHIRVRRFQWYSCFGLEDAAATGIAAGGAWMLKGNIIGLLDHYIQLVDAPQYSISPIYDGLYSETDLSCMISFRIGHAMSAGIQIVKFWNTRKPHRRRFGT